MLNQLMSQCPNVVSGANMLAGTSKGAGIVAAQANGQSPSELITMFTTSEVKFYNDLSFNPASNPNLPQYDIATFATGMAGNYGLQTLEDLKTKKGFDVLMTSFNIGNDASGEAWGPVLFHNLPGSQNSGTLVADAVVASGAMHGMFGTYGITANQVKNYYVDGAYVHHDSNQLQIGVDWSAKQAGPGRNARRV
jgi:patatin-like phospholipase/acyl hydrolase